MADENQDALSWLANLAQQGGTQELTPDQLLGARSELNDYYDALKGMKKEPGYEDRSGTQLPRPNQSYDLRQQLSPIAQQAADFDFKREGGAHTLELGKLQQESQKRADKAAAWIPVAQGLADLPKKALLGYGPSFQGRFFDSHTAEQTSEAHGKAVFRAVAQRIREQNPDLPDDQVAAQAQQQMQEGATVRGGMTGWLQEKVAPGAVSLIGMAPSFMVAGGVARGVLGSLGVGTAAESATLLGRIGARAAQAAATGALHGAARAREGGELDEAADLLGQITSRAKTAALSAAAFAAGDTLGEAVASLPLSGSTGWLTKAFNSSSRAQVVHEWLERSATMTGMGAAQDPMQALKHPLTTIAEGMAAAMLPGRFTNPTTGPLLERALSWGASKTNLPDEVLATVPHLRRELEARDTAQATQLAGALLQKSYSDATDDLVADLHGLRYLSPDIRQAILDAHRSQREQQGQAWDAAIKQGEMNRAVDQGAAARAAKMPGSAEEELAGQTLQKGVGEAMWPGIERHQRAIDLEAIAARMRRDQPLKDLVAQMADPKTGATPDAPTDLQSLQALRKMAYERMDNWTAAAASAKTQKDAKAFDVERQKMDRVVNGLDDTLTKYGVFPGLAHVDESLTARALRGRDPGALEVAQKDAELAIADSREAAPIPPPGPPQAAPRDPGALWTPDALQVFSDKLESFYRTLALLDSTAEDQGSPARARAEATAKLAEADINRMLLPREGRTLEQVIATTKADDDAWVKNPALSKLSSWLGWQTKDGLLTHQAGDDAKPIAGDTDAWEKLAPPAVMNDLSEKVRALAKRDLRGQPDLLDRIGERAFDVLAQATQSYARATKGQPRDAGWVARGQQEAVERALKEARSLAARTASYYQVRTAAKRYVGENDPILKKTAQTIDDAATKPIAANDPLADVQTVLKIAAAKGGPLENRASDPNAVMAAQVYLHELSEARRTQQGIVSSQARAADRPGRSPYELAKEIYVAAHGEQAWLSDLTDGERMAASRRLRKELDAPIKTLHEYLKQVADAKGLGIDATKFNPETGAFDPAMLAKLPAKLLENMGSLLWKNTKALLSPDEDLDYYRFTREQWAARPVQEPRGVAHWIEQQLGSGEKKLTTSVLGRILEIETQGKTKKARDIRDTLGRSGSIGAIASRLPDEAMIEAGKFLDGYRSDNEGKELDPNQAQRRLADALTKFTPEQQADMKKYLAAHREYVDGVREYQEEHSNRKIGYVSSYLTHSDAEATRKLADETNFGKQFETAWKTMTDGYSRDLGDEAAAKASGAPFNAAILSRSGSGVTYDLHAYRSLLRYSQWALDWTWKMEVANYWKDQRLGRYQPLRVQPDSSPGEQLSRFLGASDAKDAIKIGGSYWKLAEKPRPGQTQFELRNIGRPGELMVLRAEKGADEWQFWRRMTTQGPPGPHGEAQKVVTSERPVFPSVRQGGLEQLYSVDKQGNVTPRMNEAALKDAEERVQALVGPKVYGKVTRAINAAAQWAGRSLFFLNHTAAARAMTEGTAFALTHFGPKLYADSLRFMATREGREELEAAGISNVPSIRPNETMLPGTPAWRQALKQGGSALQRGEFMLFGADQFLKAQAYAAGLLRARRYVRKFGVPESEAADLLRDHHPDDIAEVWAKREAYVQAGHTGGLRAAITAPLINQTPFGRLFTQFKRPALLVSASTIGAMKQGLKTGNFSQALRFAAIAGLFGWLDDAFETNFGETVGPRIKDLGEEQTGSGLSEVMPSLDDPESAWSKLGDLRIPLPNPVGEGPVLGLLNDFGRTAVAMLRGDKDELARQYWESKNLTDRMTDQWVPGYKVGRKVAALVDPSLPITRLTPSGDPERPWKTVNAKGRITSLTNDELLWKQFLLGSLGNRETSETLHAMNRSRLEDDIEGAQKRDLREDWFDAVSEARQTGSASAMQRADELRGKFRFTAHDYQHEADMRALPNWARFAGKTEEQKARAILDVASHRDEIGATAQQLRLAVEKNLRHPSKMSPDTVRRLARLQQELWPNGD